MYISLTEILRKNDQVTIKVILKLLNMSLSPSSPSPSNLQLVLR
jgi:hypothetical protein